MTLKRDPYGNDVQATHPYTNQTVAVGAGSVTSAPFSNVQNPLSVVSSFGPVTDRRQVTMHIRVVATVPCWIAFGTTPVATRQVATSTYLPAGLPEYFWVHPASRIAVVQDVGAGFLYIAELAHN